MDTDLGQWAELYRKGLFNLATPLEHIAFSCLWLVDVKHMVIVTYFFRENPPSAHRLLSLISSNGSFIHTFPQTGQDIPQPGTLVYNCIVLLHWKTRLLAQ